jgi:hypothetical protein
MFRTFKFSLIVDILAFFVWQQFWLLFPPNEQTYLKSSGHTAHHSIFIFISFNLDDTSSSFNLSIDASIE